MKSRCFENFDGWKFASKRSPRNLLISAGSGLLTRLWVAGLKMLNELIQNFGMYTLFWQKARFLLKHWHQETQTYPFLEYIASMQYNEVPIAGKRGAISTSISE